jgi:predicted transposase YdaD
MSLFNRLKISIKFWMINLEAKLKNETFGMFALSGQAKESAFISRMQRDSQQGTLRRRNNGHRQGQAFRRFIQTIGPRPRMVS